MPGRWPFQLLLLINGVLSHSVRAALRLANSVTRRLETMKNLRALGDTRISQPTSVNSTGLPPEAANQWSCCASARQHVVD